MKKHFIIFGSVFFTAVLVLFAIIMCAVTKDQIDEMNMLFENSFSSQYWFYEMNKGFEGEEYIEGFELQSFISSFYEDQMYQYVDNFNSGMYNAIIDTNNDYSIIAESRDIVQVYTSYNDTYDSRIAFPSNEFFESDDLSFYSYSGFENSKVDDYFIYDGEGKVENYENALELKWDQPLFVNEDDFVSFEEWIKNGEASVDFHVFPYNQNAKKTKANNDAKKLSNEYVEMYRNLGSSSGGEVLKKLGIFTSREIYFRVEEDEGILVTYCSIYKPFERAIAQNKKFYLSALIIFILMELFIIVSTRRLYLSQKSFEIRSQRLTRGVAHELKTPLAVTKACVENWEYIDEDERHEYSEKIISEVDHMAGLITKLLELSKLSGGKSQVQREDIDLLALTRSIYSQMSELAREKNLEVSISGTKEDEDYIISADLEMMHIVISNFISNAIKYSDSFIRVAVSDLGRRIEFRITNDGAVVERKDLNKVWDVFYRTNEVRNDRIESSGVGLAVVKSILDLHKAKYGCESNVHSTTFYFIIDKAKEKN